MKLKAIGIAIVLAVAVPTAFVAADQITLSDREITPGGDIETRVFDDKTGEITISINGTPVASAPASPRELAGIATKQREDARANAAVKVAAAAATIRQSPSANPDIARLEALLLDLAAMLGVD